MEERIESSEAMRDGTVIQSGNGQTIQLLSASEQFHTRSCARCGGLLVNEWYYDLDNTGQDCGKVLRCVQCGHRIDPVILQNQTRPSVRRRHVPQEQHKYSMKTVMLDEVA